jgi:hypothetical protein
MGEEILTFFMLPLNQDLWEDKLRLSYPLVKGLVEI